MRRAFAVLAWTLALLACIPVGAQAASRWNTAGAQKLEPEPMEGDFQFAAVGTDGTDIAGWNHYTVGTTFDNQALTITPRGQAFPPAVNVSPDAYYYNDQRWSAN